MNYEMANHTDAALRVDVLHVNCRMIVHGELADGSELRLRVSAEP